MRQKFWSRLFTTKGRPLPALQALLELLRIDAKDIGAINDVCQQRYVQKLPNGLPKERWKLRQIETLASGDLYPALRQLGMVDAIEPEGNNYAGLGIFGSLQPRMCVRLAAAIDLAQRVRCSKVMLFAGQRNLQAEIESTRIIQENTAPLQLRAGIQTDAIASLRMETDLMAWYWRAAEMPVAVRQLPCDVIDAPKLQPDDPQSRPTTASQLRYWYDENKPTPGRYLLVSNQPHVYYQEAVARNVFPPDSGIEIECVGPAARLDLSGAFLLGEVARWIYEDTTRWNASRA